MRTLIVLCAGEKKVNGIPIFLQRHPDNKLIIEKVIEGVFPESYDVIVFTTLKEYEEKFRFSDIVRNSFGGKYNIRFAILEGPTNGPAESLYKTLKQLAIEGEITVRDSHNKIVMREQTNGNFVSGLNLVEYDEEVFNLQSKSFIVINEQNQVLDVVEKKLRSDVICVGAYGFEQASDFITAYEKLINANLPIQKMYLSNVISYLIGYNQKVFYCVDSCFYEDWGSSVAWNRLQKKYATLFIDIDQLIGNQFEEKQTNVLIDKLGVLAEHDMSVVLFTRALIINKEDLCNKLISKNIKCIGVVCGVSHSTEKSFVFNEIDLKKYIEV